MYCCEWSQYNLCDVDENAVYPFEKYLHTYFEKPRRRCFLLRVDDLPAGFALIDDDFVLHRDFDYSMGEFFVLPKYRRRGLGAYLAKSLFDLLPGKWELGFHPANIGSEKFWLAVVDDYTDGKFTLARACPEFRFPDGSFGSVMAFESNKAD